MAQAKQSNTTKPPKLKRYNVPLTYTEMEVITQAFVRMIAQSKKEMVVYDEKHKAKALRLNKVMHGTLVNIAKVYIPLSNSRYGRTPKTINKPKTPLAHTIET